jgi:hypothetical protein
MTAYIYITASLLLYPILGRIYVKQTSKNSKSPKRVAWALSIISILVLLGLLTHIVTISQNLNWFLVTSIYLTISVLLWLTQSNTKRIVKNTGTMLQFAIFGFGYLAATFGFLFILLTSWDLDTDQRKWLTDNLIYKERNIGQGLDPSVRIKKVEIYKTVQFLPLLAYRIQSKIYEEWDFPLKKDLDVTYSAKDQTVYLTSVVHGYKVFSFSDTINLTEKHYR